MSSGYAVWFGAHNLTDWAQAHVELLQGSRRLLELGSGLGLCGISVAALLQATRIAEAAAVSSSGDDRPTTTARRDDDCPVVVLTDGESELLPLLEANCALNHLAPQCAKLWWGDEADIGRLLSQHSGGYI
jgi:hypothetical protein